MTTLTPSASAVRRSPPQSREGQGAYVTWAKIMLALGVLGAAATVVVDLRVVLTVLNLAAFGLAIVGLRYPALGVLGIVMLCTLDPLVGPLLLTGGLFRWNTLNYWLLLVMFVWSPYLARQSDLSTRCFQLLMLVIGLGLVFGPEPDLGMQQVLRMVTMLGIMIYLMRGSESLDPWYWATLLGGTLGAVLTAAYVFNEPRLPYVNPNVWSFLPMGSMLLIGLVYPLVADRAGRQNLLGSLAVINGGWVFLSTSRGSLLVAIIILAYIVVGASNMRRSLVYLCLGGLACLFLVSQFSDLSSKSLERVQLLFDSSKKARVRTSGRWDLALGGYYIVRDHPLGVGTGGFARAWSELGRREGMSNFHQGKEFAAHSGWVKIAAENGIPGILLLLAYALSFMIVARRSPYPTVRKMGTLVSIVLLTSWLSAEFDSKGLWLFCAGATVLLQAAQRRRVEG